MPVDFNTIKLLWPEITLVAMATAIYVGSAFRRGASTWTAIAVASFVVASLSPTGSRLAEMNPSM